MRVTAFIAFEFSLESDLKLLGANWLQEVLHMYIFSVLAQPREQPESASFGTISEGVFAGLVRDWLEFFKHRPLVVREHVCTKSCS